MTQEPSLNNVIAWPWKLVEEGDHIPDPESVASLEAERQRKQIRARDMEIARYIREMQEREAEESLDPVNQRKRITRAEDQIWLLKGAVVLLTLILLGLWLAR
jgi:hypothetical protein